MTVPIRTDFDKHEVSETGARFNLGATTMRLSTLCVVGVAWMFCAACATAQAVEEKTNPITSFELTLLPPTTQQTSLFGWIRLLNGSKDAGYIYLRDGPLGDPALNYTKQYIITAMPTASIPMLLDVLRNQKNLQIRFYDPQAAGISPSVFLEPADSSGEFASSPLHLNDEMTKRFDELLHQK